MSLLIFTGAGASAELGVATMHRMAREFLRHLKDIGWVGIDYREVESILHVEDHDMEHLIDSIDRLRNGLLEQQHLSIPIDKDALVRMSSVTREAEWFVQHACEQVIRARAEALWTPLFSSESEFDLTIATTNYDRTIEIGARTAGATLASGFDDHRHVEVAQWIGF